MTVTPPSPTPPPPAGWYPEGTNGQRYWDGSGWTDHRAPLALTVAAPTARTANGMNVSYVRQQQGHSLLLHAFVIGWFCLWINVIYISASPNHYWHA